MGDDIPEWAIDRALERFPEPTYVTGESWKPAVLQNRNADYVLAVRFLASEIAEHEEPPVDPLEAEARRLATEWCGPGRMTDAAFCQALIALRRGIEIGKSDA